MPDHCVVPAKQLIVGAHKRSFMMQSRRDDQSIGGIARQPAQPDGADSNTAVYRELEQPGPEQLPAPIFDGGRQLQAPAGLKHCHLPE